MEKLMRNSGLSGITSVAAVLTAGLVLFCSVCAGWTQESLPAKRPDDLEFAPLHWDMQIPEKKRLNNGINLYHRRNSELPLVNISVMFGVGRSVETAADAGLAELFARTLESGGTSTVSPADFDACLDALAMNLNVDSGPYTTTLHVSMLKEDVARGMELLAQLIRNPGFDAERLETARQRLVEQIRRRPDDPAAIAEQLMLENLYPGHPLGRKPSLQSVRHISRADLVALHQRYFGPRNMHVAISGDITGSEAVQLLQTGFSGWDNPGEQADVPELEPLPETQVAPLVVVQRPLSQTTIRLVERGIKHDNPDVYAVEIMNYILGGGGFNSRLMREIRSNRGLAYSVFSHFAIGRRLQGAFFAGCETKAESVGEVVGLFTSIMQQMREQGVTQDELELAKQSRLNSFVFRFEDLHGLVKTVMEYDFFGYPDDYLIRYREHIRAVTAQDVQRVARKYLHPEQQALILVGDVEEDTLAQLGDERDVKHVRIEDLL
jgi:zinc protease